MASPPTTARRSFTPEQSRGRRHSRGPPALKPTETADQALARHLAETKAREEAKQREKELAQARARMAGGGMEVDPQGSSAAGGAGPGRSTSSAAGGAGGRSVAQPAASSSGPIVVPQVLSATGGAEQSRTPSAAAGAGHVMMHVSRSASHVSAVSETSRGTVRSHTAGAM